MGNPDKTDNSLFAEVVETLERQRAEGLHDGAQVYVSRFGEPLLDLAIGESAPGRALERESASAWPWSEAGVRSMFGARCATLPAPRWSRALPVVAAGIGNDGRTEGAWHGKILGTYAHGPALARNPGMADLLLRWATGADSLTPLDDTWADKLRGERLAAAGAI